MKDHEIPMEFVDIPTSWEMEQQGIPEEPQFQIMSTAQEILKDKDRKINPVKVANKLTMENDFIYCASNFYIYQDGVYKLLNHTELEGMVKKILGNSYTLNRAKEVMGSIKADTFLKLEELNKFDFLNLKNGLFDIEQFRLKPHTPKEYSTVQLNVNYDPNAQCDLWIKSLYEIFEGSKEKVRLLQEYFGLCLTKRTNFEKALFCIGEGSNGKSVVMHVLQELLGADNYAAVPLEKFKNQNYLAYLFGRLANISIEASAEKYICDSNFKAIVSGDTITADAKYKDPMKFRPFCKLVVALNQMPKVEDKSYAFYRRLLFLRFNRQFEGESKNENLKYEIAETELDGVFLWSLQGLKRLSERRYFEITEEMIIEIERYRKDNNTVLLFIEEECEMHKEFNVSKGELYKAYRIWCEEAGHKPYSKTSFGRELKRQFPDISDERDSKSWYWSGIRIISDDLSVKYDMNDTDDIPF